jgi:branched-chain amino acid transport system substrate-binding protein
MKTKIKYGLAVTLLMVLYLCGFSNLTLAQDEFVYGAIMPVTGPIPQYGEHFIRGSQFALEDLGKSGWVNGKKLRIVLEDSKADPKIALSAMNKLVNIDKVPIVEACVSPVLAAIYPVAEKNGVVLVNTAAQGANLRKNGPYFISMNPLADSVMEMTVKYASQGMKAKTASIMLVNNDYGLSVSDTFSQLFEKQYGGKILAKESIVLGETDYTTHLTKLKFVKSDIIFMVAQEAEFGYALKKAKQIGLKTTFLATPGMTGPMTVEIAKDAIEGVKTPDYLFDPVHGTKRMKEFGQRFKQRYGIMPSTFAAYTYDSIMLYVDALKSGARTGKEIRDYYLASKRVGLSGPIAFDKDGITTTPAVIREFSKDGTTRTVKW